MARSVPPGCDVQQIVSQPLLALLFDSIACGIRNNRYSILTGP